VDKEGDAGNERSEEWEWDIGGLGGIWDMGYGGQGLQRVR
jgi:hypothetical protein